MQRHHRIPKNLIWASINLETNPLYFRDNNYFVRNPISLEVRVIMKKFYGAVILAVLFLSVFSSFVLVVNAQQENSWPMFHGDVAHTGYSTGSGPSTNQTLWTFKTNGEVWSSPAVADGIVYVASFDRNLYAINAVNWQGNMELSAGRLNLQFTGRSQRFSLRWVRQP